ncbi:MAG: OmpA family protein [Cyclobacteriaceae bacterium]
MQRKICLNVRHILLISGLLGLAAAPALAQKKPEKLKQAGRVELRDSLTQFSQSDIFDFPNLYTLRRFHDATQLKKLEQLEKSGDEPALYAGLRDYVRQFGIENFTHNLAMLWKLAALSRTHGPKGEAVLLYKLLLKHHVQGLNIEKIFAEYAEIEPDRKQYYVPLEEYYRLVDLRKEIDTLRPPHNVLTNMGDAINSRKEDYGPTIGNIDDVLLFTSKRNIHEVDFKRTYDEDLFISVRSDGYWSPAEPLRKINSSYNEGSACLSRNGKELYFSRCGAPDSFGNCDLYFSILQADSTWGTPKNLGAAVNSKGWDSHPSLTHSGDTLFFTSNRLGGFGLADIYYSVKADDGSWQEARNAGPVINTAHNDVSPFFHHLFNVLYFSSDGNPMSFGEFDIYKSYRLPRAAWSEPKNIGPLVNGPGSEYYFTIDSKSKELYYARTEENGSKNFDLYSFPVPMEARPESVARLNGSLKATNGTSIKGIVSIIDLDHGVEVAPRFLREDGTFDFDLINHRNYLLIIQGDEFFRIEELFYMNDHYEVDRTVAPIEPRIAFNTLEFENGKSDILESMHSDLDKVANFMIDHPDVHLRIGGHTDSAGNEQANLRLSQNRADAIRTYLLTFGIDPGRIEAIGYGSSKPFVEEKTEEDKQVNRRVEFEIFRQSPPER